jgi:hypothetical protein
LTSECIDLSKIAGRKAANHIYDRLLVHAQVFGTIGCRHRPVQPGHVSKGGPDGLSAGIAVAALVSCPHIGGIKALVKTLKE